MSRRVRGAPAAAAGIVVSRSSGLVRSALVTNVLGIGLVGDAFAAALRIPNVLQNLLGEGALSAAFVPEYSSTVDDDPEEAGRLAGAVATFLLALTAVLVLVGLLAARPLTRAIAWGFTGEKFELTVRLVRIIVLGSGLLVLTAWCLGILNSHRRFFLSYVAPVLWNAAQIATVITVVAVGWADVDIAEALAWAIVIGALAQLVLQVPAALRANRSIRLTRPDRHDGARRVIHRFGPAVLGRGAMQLSGFLDLALATLLATGAAAAMAAAQTLYILPLSVIGLSVVATELPELSRLGDIRRQADRVRERLLQTGFLISGVVAVYFTSAVPLVDSIFNLGGFRERIDGDDIRLVAYVVMAFSIGLPAIVGSRLLQNVFYSTGDTSTPARIALIRITVSFIVGVSLMFPLDRIIVLDGALSGFGDLEFVLRPLDSVVRADELLPTRLGAVGLAIGAAVGAWVEFAMLRGSLLLRWDEERLVPAQLGRHVVPPVVAVFVGAAVGFTVSIDQPLVSFAIVGAVTGAIHLGLGVALRCEGAQALVSTLRAGRITDASSDKEPQT